MVEETNMKQKGPQKFGWTETRGEITQSTYNLMLVIIFPNGTKTLYVAGGTAGPRNGLKDRADHNLPCDTTMCLLLAQITVSD
jgi:hypothetical protein